MFWIFENIFQVLHLLSKTKHLLIGGIEFTEAAGNIFNDFRALTELFGNGFAGAGQTLLHLLRYGIETGLGFLTVLAAGLLNFTAHVFQQIEHKFL